MAIRQTFKPADSSTFANWKLWTKEIEDAFLALGWTRTADTGQVDWATIAAIPVAATPAYFIMQMTDALAATSPFVMKVEVGQGSTANQGQIWLTPGNGTNGAGVLSGGGTRQMIYGASGMTNQGATGRECNFSGSTSRFNCYLFRDLANSTVFAFGFERALDNAGATLDSSATFWVSGFGGAGGVGVKQQSILKTGGGASPGVETDILMLKATTLTSSLFANKIGVQPACGFVGNYTNPLISIVGLKGNEAVDGALITVNLYGTDRTMMSVKNANVTPITSIGTGGAAAMGWF